MGKPPNAQVNILLFLMPTIRSSPQSKISKQVSPQWDTVAKTDKQSRMKDHFSTAMRDATGKKVSADQDKLTVKKPHVEELILPRAHVGHLPATSLGANSPDNLLTDVIIHSNPYVTAQ